MWRRRAHPLPGRLRRRGRCVDGLRFHPRAAGAAVEGDPLNVGFPRAETTRDERLNIVVLAIMSAVFLVTRRHIPMAGALACGFAGLAIAIALLPRIADRWPV